MLNNNLGTVNNSLNVINNAYASKYLTAFNNINIINKIENLGLVLNQHATIRGLECQGSPYGDISNDFFYYIIDASGSGSYWRKVIAFDVRSNAIFTNTQTNGAWNGWSRIGLQAV